MTFKDVRIWSRSMTCNEIIAQIVKHNTAGLIKEAYFYNSMLWLKLFAIDRPHLKIRDWMYALQTYKSYKTFK